MREYVINLTGIDTFDQVVAAFNEGLIHRCGGSWNGRSWDAFHDYLSWPEEQPYRLILQNWLECHALGEEDRRMIREIFADNPHVNIVYVG